MSCLFIGLGGAGTSVLDCLYEKMDTYNQDMARQGLPQVDTQYYYIDTENARWSKHPEEFMVGTNKTFFQIGQESPEAIIAGFQRGNDTVARDFLKKWYDAPAKTTNRIMDADADAIRQLSRLALMSRIQDLRNSLYPLIGQVTESNGRIYVITGSCGDTGCGIYMDILYLISEIYEYLQTPQASTDVRLIIAMPEGYVAGGNRDAHYKKIKLNAFATLEELNAVCKDIHSFSPKFNGCYVGNVKKTGVFQPFRFGYLYDTAYQSRNDVSKNLSDFLFELEFAGEPSQDVAPVFGYEGSFFDGLLTGVVDGNWNASINNPYVRAFNALGQYSIEKPDFLYREYFSDRLLYDTFHEGLIGSREHVDDANVTALAQSFKDAFNTEVTNTLNAIVCNDLSSEDFGTDTKAKNTFSIFTNAPNLNVDIVRTISTKKTVLLQTIKNLVYRQCKDWLEQYDFTTVYAILGRLDSNAYQAALDTNREFDEQLAKAKEESTSRGLFGLGREHVDSDKALKQFTPLLHTWLTFEVNKALSSGVDVDISIQNQGYLDQCKDFIEKAKRNLFLEKEQEHWDESFRRKVVGLKMKKDRSYIPDLNTIVDDRGEVIPDCTMVSIYENDVVADSLVADMAQGTCTPAMLHSKIIGEMIANPSLRQEGIDMDVLFDPTPGRQNSLQSESKAKLFVEKYVATAREQISILLSANQPYQNLFASDIQTRLLFLPQAEKANICMRFRLYDQVQLRTCPIPYDALTSFTYYLVSSSANTPLMQELGILNNQGMTSPNSSYTTNPFFEDKIVKMIVKNGYKIDDYRYFDDYKWFAQNEMKYGLMHDPFIDKRFLGVLDQHGKYPCNVSDALETIENGINYSLDGFDKVEVVKFCLALLYEFFDALKQAGRIDCDLGKAISHMPGTSFINIQQLIYSKSRKKYALGATHTIDLSAEKPTVNLAYLNHWIHYIRPKKDVIENENELYTKALIDFDLHLDPALEDMISNMMGDGDKPVYDFFAAYLEL